jgi:hypothetical protein
MPKMKGVKELTLLVSSDKGGGGWGRFHKVAGLFRITRSIRLLTVTIVIRIHHPPYLF